MYEPGQGAKGLCKDRSMWRSVVSAYPPWAKGMFLNMDIHFVRPKKITMILLKSL